MPSLRRRAGTGGSAALSDLRVAMAGEERRCLGGQVICTDMAAHRF